VRIRPVNRQIKIYEKKLPLVGNAVFMTVMKAMRLGVLSLAFLFFCQDAVSQIQLLKDVNTREEPLWNEYAYPVFTQAGVCLTIETFQGSRPILIMKKSELTGRKEFILLKSTWVAKSPTTLS
jgi:hypothetical protein